MNTLFLNILVQKALTNNANTQKEKNGQEILYSKLQLNHIADINYN